MIGSGPAGWASTQGLLQRGFPVTVLDVGHGLETSLMNRLAGLRELAAGPNSLSWTSDDIADLTSSDRPTRLAGKLYFGSDAPYRYVEGIGAISSTTGSVLPVSGSRGGLSNVWGAGALTLSRSDLSTWPVNPDDMIRAYAVLSTLTPLLARADDLDVRYPLVTAPAESPPTSQRFLRVLQHADDVRRHGVLLGTARLLAQPLGAGCTGCGRCLTGCPFGAIFDSGRLFGDLREHPLVDYRPGAFVESIREHDGGLELGVRGPDGRRAPLHANRVFVAAGAVASVALLQRSGMCSPEVDVRDSQVFYLPALLKSRWTSDSSLFTLAQVFAVSERGDPETDFQLSLYDTSPELAERFALAVPRHLRRAVGLISPHLAKRLVGGIGFLHSEVSGALRVSTLNGETKVRPIRSGMTGPALAGVLRELRRALGPAGVHLVTPLVQVPEPGEGFHVGSALPMAAEAGPLRTDPLGRPFGVDRVHVVDASVLPQLHPGPTTYTAMANALRIASAISDSP